ncbi:bifunctional (p)ppGpp synthetase/guanosine-3',5'-bis(diphosphate) 3'-pyrophosphohydrolase [Candidatus Peregrinibacteria bacterium]|nr:bifunctional (p)ppGpp synthetase/guanosine-3',5'-bis(diphosphate) 3'-pyrophosphohydrolase [Candidatus Peregrinibacteria bacterium]MBT4632194.1 bifunctional (p)ppGpp synthetase/guanosine-3',5'-bis(diphosphate) 3'-pyrophosphohydrolase [Candidatus Peregrinibacteria bacterium]
MEYAELRAEIERKRPELDLALIDASYEFARKAHEGQKRYSGKPYISHPVGATQILLRLQPDLPTIQACLMHDVTEDTEYTLEDIEKKFGEEVAKLVQGCEKLAVVKTRGVGQQDERWKRMFLAMAKDLRIVFIKLSDRLHNMRTLEFVPEEKQQRIANESLVVHAAIASRMGIYKIKGELEDLCFKYLFPDAYKEISEKVAKYEERSVECMTFATSQIEQLLLREGATHVKVTGRMKHLWSIFQKLNGKDAEDLSSIYDLFAVRIVLPDVFKGEDEQVSHLYGVLGLLHNEYIPLQDRFKDYVAVPKPNGYRSLHTTMLGIGGDLYDEPTEVQIRTASMHKEAEIGVASHSAYKDGRKLNPKLNRKRHFALHNSLSKVQALCERVPEISGMIKEWVEDYQHMLPEDRVLAEAALLEYGMTEDDLLHIRRGRSQEQLHLNPNVEQQLAWLRGLAEESEAKAELDLYPNKIFVLTPKRDVIELPRDSTPLDFAYAIHTEVGNKVVHAKVNGRIVPLECKLKNGDMVSVGTRSNAKPNRYWLSIVKTNSAKAKIKNWFNKQDKDSNISAGRELLNNQLSALSKPLLDERLTSLKNYLGKKRDFSEREQILESVGIGGVTAFHVYRGLFPDEILREQKRKVVKATHFTSKVLVTGEEDLPVVLSSCCKPKPPVAIIGYVTRGRSIRVHRSSCSDLSGLEGERFVSTHWKES